MSTVNGFSYKGMPRILIPSDGGFSINYTCRECRKMFNTPVFPPEIWGLLNGIGPTPDIMLLLRTALGEDEFKTIFETGVCKKCESMKRFGGNEIRENEDE